MNSIAPSGFTHAWLRFPPRVVAVLCTFQVLMIVGGCLLSRAMLKAYNTALVPEWGEMPGRFHWTLKVMLAAGPWLLVIPLLWGVTATLQADLDSRTPSITAAQSRWGYLITFALFVFCLFASVSALGLVFNPVPLRNGWIME